jgi:hypothetical protein
MPRITVSGRFRSLMLAAAVAAMSMACASQTDFLNEKQDKAMQTAANRGRAELSCPQALPAVVSREVGQPSNQGTWVEGTYRATYRITVAGCGKEKNYFVICPDVDLRCFAVGPGGLADWE